MNELETPQETIETQILQALAQELIMNGFNIEANPKIDGLWGSAIEPFLVINKTRSVDWAYTSPSSVTHPSSVSGYPWPQVFIRIEQDYLKIWNRKGQMHGVPLANPDAFNLVINITKELIREPTVP